MTISIQLRIDARSPIPIRWQVSEQLRHVIEGGGVPRDEPLPSIRELAGFLGINPNTVARAIEDLKRSGHVEARRGKGVFVASTLPARPSSTDRSLRDHFLKETVIRAAALGMTPDDVAVSVLSVNSVRLAARREAAEILLIECSPAELDFFARELEGQLPVQVDKVLLSELAGALRHRRRADHWRAAVTSFGHLPSVERLLEGRGIPVLALLAEAHLETLHRLAQLPSGTRVGVVSAEAETAHNLEHSITNAALPNIARVEARPLERPGLRPWVRRVDVLVCSTSAAKRAQDIAGSTMPVIVDDRALNQRAIQMLGAILVRRESDRPTAKTLPVRTRRGPRAVGMRPGERGPGGEGDASSRRRSHNP